MYLTLGDLRSVLAILFLALSVHVQGVVTDFKLENLRHHVSNTLNAWITKFEQLVAIRTDKVVVLPEAERPFEFGLLLTKLVPNNQIAINQQLQRVVNGRSADSNIVLFQPKKELVGIEMIGRVIDLFKNDKPLRSLAKMLLFQIFGIPVSNDFELLNWKGRTGHFLLIMAERCTALSFGCS